MRSWGKLNEPPPTTPKTGLHPKNTMCVVALEGELIMSFFWKTKEFQWVLLSVKKLKAALDEEHPDLVNRKHIIFHQDNAKLHVCLMTRQNYYNLAGKFWFIQCIHHIEPSDVHLFQVLQNSLNGKNINSLEDCKRQLEQFFAQKGKFGEDGIMYEVALKMAEGSGTKSWICCSIQFLMKMQNVAFIFT